VVNTFIGMAIDVEKRRPRLRFRTGGLSGPAIKPIALRMVWEVCQAVKIPVIGIGGIAGTEDALEFLIAGAGPCRLERQISIARTRPSRSRWGCRNTAGPSH